MIEMGYGILKKGRLKIKAFKPRTPQFMEFLCSDTSSYMII